MSRPPLRLIRIDNLAGTIEAGEITREVSLMLLPEEARIGDDVLVRAGFAIQKLD